MEEVCERLSACRSGLPLGDSPGECPDCHLSTLGESEAKCSDKGGGVRGAFDAMPLFFFGHCTRTASGWKRAHC
jgi:hypothetical protein